MAAPIIHCFIVHGANIAEIQIYYHDKQGLVATPCRIESPSGHWPAQRPAMEEIDKQKGGTISSHLVAPDAR